MSLVVRRHARCVLGLLLEETSLFPLSLSIVLPLRPPSLSAPLQLSLPPLPPRLMNGEPSQRRQLYLAILRVSTPKNHPKSLKSHSLLRTDLRHSRDLQGVRAGRAQIAAGSPAPATLNRSYDKRTMQSVHLDFPTIVPWRNL